MLVFCSERTHTVVELGAAQFFPKVVALNDEKCHFKMHISWNIDIIARHKSTQSCYELKNDDKKQTSDSRRLFPQA